MFRMRTLGGAVVEGPVGPVEGSASQRKPLAFLALLASAGERGMSRDRIIAYLWPGVASDRAGHRLTQLVYALRRDLAADDLISGSPDLRLNPERFDSDVRHFSVAREAGRLEQAVGLYAGPFLDGFFLPDNPEFEQWIDMERARLARDYAELVETLAAAAQAQGDHRHAVHWWQRLADHDPLSSRVTVELMSALAAAGNRAAALDRAQAYQELLRRQLEATPNPAVLALAEHLRLRPPEGLAAAEAPRLAANSLAVLPFANLSALTENDYFAEGLAEELMERLAQAGMRVASRTSVGSFRNAELDAREIGRRLNVATLLEGSIRQAAGQVRLTAHLIDVVDGCSLWSGKYERPAESPFAVQDELAALIVEGVRRSLGRPGTAPPPVTVESSG
jgi:TolB-like protein